MEKIYCAVLITGIFSAAPSVLHEGGIDPLLFKNRLSAGKATFNVNAVRKAEEAIASDIHLLHTLI